MALPSFRLPGKSARVKAFVLAIPLAVIMLLVANSAGVSLNASGLCTSCHEMKPEQRSTQNSSHAKVDCATCHVENISVEAIRMARRTVSHFSGSAPAEIKLNRRIPNEECTQCHNLRKVTTSGDIIIDHDVHVRILKMPCIQCHNRVAHTDQIGYFDGSRMTSCLQCHNDKLAPRACGTCHSSNRNRPEEHNVNWWRRHGQEAYKDSETCKGCHGWTEDFCKDCHKSGRPPSHSENWNFLHSETARGSAGGCNICHETSFCNKCHEVKHPDNWLQVHFQSARTGITACYKCHQNTYCASCHTRSLPRNRTLD